MIKLDARMMSAPIAPTADRQLEMELLLCCSHTQPTAAHHERIQALVRQPLDWEYTLERATHHNIRPLLDRQLQAIDHRQVPSDILDRLRANFDLNFQQNLRLTLELVKLSRLFAERSIPMLSFKGPVLAQLAYGNLGLRQFIDLDLLVPEADVVRTSHFLSELGYQSQFTLTDKQQAVYLGLRSEQWFWHEEKQICIDLHWSILPKHYSFTPAPELLWANLDRVEFAKESVATLSPEHHLLFLCAHGAKHNWSRLYWICDLAELLRVKSDLDWLQIQNLAGAFGTQKMLLLGLYLAHDLLGAELPAAILALCDLDLTLPQLADRVRIELFRSPPPESADDLSVALAPANAIYRQTLGSIGDRLRYWIDLILTPTPLEWEIVSLPQWLFPLYYSIRLIRLSVKHTLKLEI